MSIFLSASIMPIQRSIYFANGDAYCIHDTINYIYTLKDRLELFHFDHVIADLFDMKFLSAVGPSDPMIDIFNGQTIRRDVWFLRYGVRDTTFEYFDGSVETFPTGDIELTHPNEEAIDSDDEEALVEGATLVMNLGNIEELDDISLISVRSDDSSVVFVMTRDFDGNIES